MTAWCIRGERWYVWSHGSEQVLHKWRTAFFLCKVPCVRILECFTHTQGSAAQSFLVQHSTVPNQYWHASLETWPWTVALESVRAQRSSHKGSNPIKHVFIKHMWWVSLLNTFLLCSWFVRFFFLMGSQMHINTESYNEFWILSSVPVIQRSRHISIVNYAPLGRKCNRTWITVCGYVLQCM